MSNRLEIRRAKVQVGDRELVVQGMTLRQAEALASALKTLDLAPLTSALRPAIESSDVRAALGAASGNVLDAILDLLQSSTKTAADVVSIVLDNLPNYQQIKAAHPDDVTDPTTGRFGTYLTSDDLREWVRLSITPAQAVEVFRACTEVSDLQSVGKALLGLVTQATEAAPKASPTVQAPAMTQ